MKTRQAATARTNRSNEGNGPNSVILGVIDAPFDSQPPTLLLQLHEQDDFSEKLRSLPPHFENTARLFDYYTNYRNLDDETWRNALLAALAAHMENTYGSSNGSGLPLEDLEYLFNARSTPSTNDVSRITQISTQNSLSSIGKYLVSTKMTTTWTEDRLARGLDSQFTACRHDNNKIVGMTYSSQHQVLPKLTDAVALCISEGIALESWKLEFETPIK